MENNNRVDKLIGVGAGYAVYKYTPRVVYSVNNLLTGKLSGTNLPEEERMALKQIGNDLFEQRFKSMGFTLVDVAKPENMNYGRDRLQRYNKAFDNSIAQSKNFIQRAYRKYWKNFYMRELEGLNYATEKGLNAYFDRGTKSFVVNMDKKAVSLFHEMGHGLDFLDPNISQIMKAYKNPKYHKFSLLGILAISLLTNKKSKQEIEESNNPLVGVGQFVKNNGGILAMLALAPAVMEECLASVKGQKLAKSVVPKELLSRVTKNHWHSALGYITWGLSAGLAIYSANLVRDKIVHKN